MPNRRHFIRQTTAFALAAGLLPGFAAPCLAQAAPNIPQLPELTWEKRSDWIDVTRDVTPAAVGDGVADDTEALQAAFDKVRTKGSSFSTVYFPPGTYRIIRTIAPKRIGLPPGTTGGAGWVPMHIRGHGRSSRIVWDGATGGRMFRSLSASYATFIGIVWDGQGKAAEGFIHDGEVETKVTHQHEAFMNFVEVGCGTTEVRYLESTARAGAFDIDD